MSQHDYIIANDTGANVRSDLNNALAAIASNNSGSTEPSTTYAFQWWYDTTNNLLKLRNSANSAWITLPFDPTTSGEVNITANSTATADLAFSGGDVTFGDGDKAIFGAGSDLQIYHDSSHSYIVDAGTGNLSIQANAAINLKKYTGETLATFVADGASTLYYDNAIKIATTSTGIDVTGEIQGDSLDIDGVVNVDTSTASDYAFRFTNSSSSGYGFLATAGNGSGAIAKFRDYAENDRMFLSGDGYLGIGTNNPSDKLHIINAGAASIRAGYNTSKYCRVGRKSDGDYEFSSYENGSALRFGTSGTDSATTERMCINSSGKVGIGNTNPQNNLTITYSSTGAVPTTEALSASTTAVSISNISNSATYSGISIETRQSGASRWLIYNEWKSTYVGDLVFRGRNGGTTSAERMRIDSSGNLCVGTTSTFQGERLSVESGYGGGIAVFNRTDNIDSNSRDMILFKRGSTGVGQINCTNTSTSYVTSSDYRLKTDVQPMTGATERLKALKPVNFEWISSGERVDGFLAHEAQEVVPEAVTGTKDAVIAYGNVTDAEGTVIQEDVTEPETLEEGQVWTKVEDKPDYQGIDQSKLTPLLTAALQEAIAKIEDLESRLAALES